MAKLKLKGRTKAPGVAVPIKGTKFEAIKGKHCHPLISFQPTMTATVSKSAYNEDDIKKLKDWWDRITDDMLTSNWVYRDGPFIETSQGTVIVWTFSGDLDDQDMDEPRFGDDCE